MLLRQASSRLHPPLSWLSRSPCAIMPLRAKVTGPANSALRMASTDTPVPRELPGDDPDDVLFYSQYGVRLIELNRPNKLNSLNGSMARKIIPRLLEWRKSQLANIIMISGAGSKAFCAGGDVAALAELNKQGEEGQQKSVEYFGLEYSLDHLIATYDKPYVAIMDGITMGGGVGLSIHAPFRIATERTVFAMPETTIGFFPDVGGSFFLPRMDGEIGTYLALTSERLNGVQSFYAGVATHYVHSTSLNSLTSRLSELVFKDYATYPERLALVNRTISEFTADLPHEDEEPMLLAGSLRQAIDRCFGYHTVEEIIQALEREEEQKEWAQKTLETLRQRSPTSLKVTLRQLRLGKKWGIAETFQREYQLASRFMRHPDFVEGVSARLLSKPPRKPEWQPSSLDAVSSETVDEFFAALPRDKQQRLGLYTDINYKQYPHLHHALPSEAEIERYVRANGGSAKDIITEFFKRWEYKPGVKTKVRDVLQRKTTETESGLRWID